MNVRFDIARAIGAVSTWGLQHVFGRPAANFPGKIGLYADPNLIADLRGRIGEGSVVVVGTNGKTTVTNLIADALEACGKTVACNRTGANLDSGVTSALLHQSQPDWAVLECDELWLSRIVAQLEPDYAVLLNLFRDQLDRMGEIALIQERIVWALEASPATILIYNSDDPLCQAIADRVGNTAIPFGIAESLGLPQNTVADAGICQRCDGQLRYEWRQYGQLGSYLCPRCGFSRADPTYTAANVGSESGMVQLDLRGGRSHGRLGMVAWGTYMIYNVLAAFAAADCCGVSFDAFEKAVNDFDPQNGRLQQYRIGGMNVVLNLAKNPTGFNQNIDIILREPGPKAAAFFINDKEADGHDVSWLWDVDFQELVWADSLVCCAGGTRRCDMQVRLKHAGIDAQLVGGASDFLRTAAEGMPQPATAQGADSHEANEDSARTRPTCFLIVNYTALPDVKAELDRLERECADGSAAPGGIERGIGSGHTGHSRSVPKCAGGSAAPAWLERKGSDGNLTIVHLYPKLLNLYGDGGNVTVLSNRARWRGLSVCVSHVDQGDSFDLSDADIVFLGGGPDREQHRASLELAVYADDLRDYVEDDGVLLAICGGYQILGREWLMGDETVAGLGIIDATTERAAGNAHNRLVGNIALESPLAALPVIGYENHAGRTYLGPGVQPFGTVIGSCGFGNNDVDRADGVLYRNVVGTYLHGPVLSKNPEVADWLITRALERRAAKEGRSPIPLQPLDDTLERAANDYMRTRLKLRL